MFLFFFFFLVSTYFYSYRSTIQSRLLATISFFSNVSSVFFLFLVAPYFYSYRSTIQSHLLAKIDQSFVLFLSFLFFFFFSFIRSVRPLRWYCARSVIFETSEEKLFSSSARPTPRLLCITETFIADERQWATCTWSHANRIPGSSTLIRTIVPIRSVETSPIVLKQTILLIFLNLRNFKFEFKSLIFNWQKNTHVFAFDVETLL